MAARRLAPWRNGRRQHRGERMALAIGHRPDRLVLRERDHRQELPATRAAPTPLAHQEITNGHALGLGRAGQNDLSGAHLPGSNTALELGPSQANLVGALEGLQVLW